MANVKFNGGNIRIEDNSEAVKAQLTNNIGKCLNMFGMTFTDIATEKADERIYRQPPPPSAFRASGALRNDFRTGNYGRSFHYEVDIPNKEAIVTNTMNYAIFIEMGANGVPAQNIIRDSVQDHRQTYEENGYPFDSG